MKLTLDTLRLTNFQGAESLTVEAQGQDLNIFGDNGTGKTTLANAYNWLWFGKDSLQREKFDIKRHDPATGQTAPGTTARVEGCFTGADGEKFTLLRELREKWQTERGSAETEFHGHTQYFEVNGVPCNETEFNRFVQSVCAPSRFRLLSEPSYSTEVLPWQKLREALLEVCGDYSDADVIAANEALKELPDILGKQTLDAYRKIIDGRQRKINERLKELPTEIKGIQSVSPPEERLIEAPDGAAEELRRLQEHRATIAAGGAVAEKTKQLRDLEAEGQAIANRANEAARGESDKAYTQKRAKQSEADAAESEVSKIERYIAGQESEKASLQRRREAKVQEWNTVQAREFKSSEPDSCAACGQKLPAEKVEAARAKALEEFNEKKSLDLTAIEAEGQQVKASIELCEAGLTKAASDLEAAKEKAARLRAEADAIVVPPAASADLSSNEEFAANTEARRALADEINQLRNGNASALADVDAQIAAVEAQLAQARESVSRAEQRAKSLARIEELSNEQRRLAGEYEDLERHLWLTEEFVRTKVSMLEEGINSKFRVARFKLFEQQVNGGLAECCSVVHRGVAKSINTGMRINLGLDIISTLSEHYKFAPPIFIDGAESVTEILPTPGQQIRLVVSGQDKALRIERAQEKEKVTA